MRRDLRAKELALALAIEAEVLVMMEAMATWTAQLAAATPTRYELKQRSWLEKVSAHATVEECGMATHQCRPCHPQVPQNVRTDSSGSAIDAEESNPYLEKSAKRIKSKRPTG